MIVLDTNVLSELMKEKPSTSLQDWISDYDLNDLYTTSINEAEILAGLALLPVGRRREVMTRTANHLLETSFPGRILPFDRRASPHYAELAVLQRRRGFGPPTLDTLIAAVARSRGFAVATRDIRHFEAYGLVLHDPWGDPQD